MFVEIQKDKVRKGLLGLRVLFDEYAPLVTFEIKCVGLMVDDEMVGAVVFGGNRIFSLAVAKNHRGCGYGRRLFDYAVVNSNNGAVTAYIPKSYHKSVAAFISWGCFFDGFYTRMGSKTRCYRIVHDKNRVDEGVEFYDGKLWEDTATLAEEAVVAFNVGMVT